MKRRKLQLKAYSCMCIAYLGYTEKGESQIVYRDINPDVILDEDWETESINLDYEMGDDFRFLNVSFLYSDDINSTFFQDIWVFGSNYENSIACSYPFKNWAYALSLYNMISDELLFNNYFWQKMAYKEFAYIYFAASDTWKTFTHTGGNWYPEKLDHYVGVRFIDEDSCFHYGWIRCDVKDEGRTLVIKDFAYQQKCDQPIAAGDSSNSITSTGEETVIEAQVFAKEHTVHVHLNTTEEAQVSIYSVRGEIIYHAEIYFGETQIEIQDQGMYFVEIYSNNKKLVKKILIQ